VARSSTVAPGARDGALIPEPFPERLEATACVLRRWHAGDEAVLGDLVELSRDHLARFMDVDREEPGVPAVHRALLARWDDDWHAGRGASYQVLDDDGEPCGAVSIHAEHVADVLHVGYWLAPWAVGRGRATSGVAVLAATALARPGVRTVIIRHAADNERSEAVARRLGFRRRRADTCDAPLGRGVEVTVQWEADRFWRPPLAYSAKSPTGHETPVPPSPQ
jgi:RimJ/RimL family protein N-acetyltransferase